MSVTILWRLVGEPVPLTSAYTDVDSVSAWAQDAMKWSNTKGIITGRAATALVPGGSTTRAEAAAILQRFIENIA